jgi:hypothetical protein
MWKMGVAALGYDSEQSPGKAKEKYKNLSQNSLSRGKF